LAKAFFAFKLPKTLQNLFSLHGNRFPSAYYWCGVPLFGFIRSVILSICLLVFGIITIALIGAFILGIFAAVVSSTTVELSGKDKENTLETSDVTRASSERRAAESETSKAKRRGRPRKRKAAGETGPSDPSRGRTIN
jgi:hypothetical protein